MFNILYRGAVYTYQCDSFDFKAGMIATFSGNRCVKIATDKDIPIGFFTNDSGGSPFERSVPFPDWHQAIAVGQGEYVAIAVGQGEYTTDVIEPGEYNINDFLYCSCNGKITNEKGYWGNIIVGIVNNVEGSLIGFVTCFIKGLESVHVSINENIIRKSRYDLIKSK